MLSELHLREVGPAPAMDIEFAERLNIFTGDNGLGKTFLLDCAWWALTHSWPGSIALPRKGSSDACIGFLSTPGTNEMEPHYTRFDYRMQTWWRGYSTSDSPAVYARTDGGVSVYEPLHMGEMPGPFNPRKHPEDASTHFDADAIWDGIRDGDRVTCNGLIADLARWQFSPERGNSNSPFATFERVLSRLSHPDEPVTIGMPSRVYLDDARQYPTLELPYTSMPIHLAPSGLKRILALAYVMVWAWTEHLSLASLTNTEPADHIDVLIDEIGLHLHPKWQRSILPSLLQIGEELAPGKAAQFFVRPTLPSSSPRSSPPSMPIKIDCSSSMSRKVACL